MSKTDDLIAWPIRCSTCGEGEVSPLARPGRTARYKNMAALPIPDDLAIPTCGACGAEWIDRPTAVEAAIEDARHWLTAMRVLGRFALRKIADLIGDPFVD